MTETAETWQAIRDRRAAARDRWIAGPVQPAAPGEPGLVGLALSGGGIRSATFSLGLIQAIAKQKQLASIDFLSTVSGGGYIGCFLRSLFVPPALRGISPQNDLSGAPRAAVPEQPPALTPAELETQIGEQYRFATSALEAEPGLRTLDRPGKPSVRSPIWWLREHSRYLSPNGPSDFRYAAAYIARNWLAMIYVFCLAVGAMLAVLNGIAGLFAKVPGLFGWTYFALAPAKAPPCCLGPMPDGAQAVLLVSPLFALAPAFLTFSIAWGIAYWMTEGMSANEPDAKRQNKSFRKAVIPAGVGWVLVLALVAFVAEPPLRALGERTRHIEPIATAMLAVGLAVSAIGIAIAVLVFLRACKTSTLRTAELRRTLTDQLGYINLCTLGSPAIGLIDSLGAALRQWGWTIGHGASLGGLTAIGLPALAFLIKKLPDWFGGGGGRLMAGLMRFLPALSLAAGCMLFGTLAVIVDAAIHAALWTGASWTSEPDWTTFLLFAGLLALLSWLVGRASGFINLSSLHSFYTARLTRAYLGASNLERLESVEDESEPDIRITENSEQDYVQPTNYARAPIPAPNHIINITLNQTIDKSSQLVSRDRKGVPVSVEPGGIRIDREPAAWERLGGGEAEGLSLGQWCAISGAAASSGMGRLTSLGYALILTFANVRLGYWWWAPGLRPEDGNGDGDDDASKIKAKDVKKATLGGLLAGFFQAKFSTFIYLWNEMTARYSRSYERQYLSDGGHFENTGAYPLLRQRVPHIVVSDNGADPGCGFADLENLVRKVRLDLGGELSLLGGHDLKRALSRLGCRIGKRGLFVDPAADPTWKTTMNANQGEAFALVLEARFDDVRCRVIWIKPRPLAHLPQDVAVYAAENPDFPQQTTGDQFFDEAQWESYRKLGEVTMTRLLDACPKLLAPA